MPVLLAFITEGLDFSPSRLVLEDGCVLSRWFRCLMWGGLMEVDRSLLLGQGVKEVSEVSYLFFLLCLFLTFHAKNLRVCLDYMDWLLDRDWRSDLRFRICYFSLYSIPPSKQIALPRSTGKVQIKKSF